MNSFGESNFNLNSDNKNGVLDESKEINTNSLMNTNTNCMFSDEDFKIPVNKFVDELDVLEKKTIVMSGDNSEPSLARMSLFRQFDPLVETNVINNDLINKTNNISFNSMISNISETQSQNQSQSVITESNENNITINMSSNESTTLMNFNSPLIVPNSSSKTNSNQQNINKNDAFFQNNDNKCCQQLSNALQTKELLFQEKLIEKERQIFQLTEELNVVKTNCGKYENLLNLLHNFNQEVVEIASELIENLIEEKNELIDRCNQMTTERSQAIEDVNSVEKSFYEVHNRYDKVRTALEESKLRETQFNQQYLELIDKLNEKDQMYDFLKAKAEEKIEDANTYVESARRECESELIAVKAQLKRSEMKINGLQAQLDQKTIENDELTKMVDDLIANVEK